MPKKAGMEKWKKRMKDIFDILMREGNSKLPNRKELQEEIQRLTVLKNAGYNDYRAKRERFRELQTVRGNINQILHREPSRQKKHEQGR